MTDLDKLIAAVEAGRNATWFTIGQAISRPASSNEVKWAQAAADGDLNAALRLHGALLPGCHWSIAEDDDYGFCGKVFCNGWHHEHSNVASRAFLLAILRALKAKGDAP